MYAIIVPVYGNQAFNFVLRYQSLTLVILVDLCVRTTYDSLLCKTYIAKHVF